MPDENTPGEPFSKATQRAVERSLKEMVLSHENALFGYFDSVAVRYVPGLLQRVDDDSKKLDTVAKTLTDLKNDASGIGDAVAVARFVKRWGPWAVFVVILLLLAVVTRQYNLIPLILSKL